jgi:hypothetical protein
MIVKIIKNLYFENIHRDESNNILYANVETLSTAVNWFAHCGTEGVTY